MWRQDLLLNNVTIDVCKLSRNLILPLDLSLTDKLETCRWFFYMDINKLLIMWAITNNIMYKLEDMLSWCIFIGFN